MKLAAASGSELSTAADVATDVMMNFGKEAKELEGLVDGITGVLLESKFGFDDYRLALGQAGGVAGNLGVSFEDFNASIAATSSAFASGSDAGTSFKTFLTRLVPASSTAAAAIDNLGLQFFEADGSMKSMAAIAGELQTKMSGLSDEELNSAMSDIFGVDAMRTGIMLMKQGSQGIDEFKARIGNASAEEQAAARLKGFNGELEKLSGAFETLQIAIADSGLLAVVTEFVGKMAEWIDALAESNPELLKWGTIIAGLTAVLGPVVLALGLVVSAIAAIGAPIALAIAAFASLAAGIVIFKDDIMAAMVVVNDHMVAAVDGAIATIQGLKDALIELGRAGLEAVNAMVTGIVDLIVNKLSAAFETVKAKIVAVKDSFFNLYDAVIGHSYIPDMVEGIGEWMAKLTGNMVVPAQQAAAGTAQAFASIGSSATASAAQATDAWAGLREVNKVGKETTDTFGGMFQSFGSSIAEAIKGTKSWSDVLKDVLGQIGQLLLKSAFGGGGGGFGGFLSGLLGGLVGFADGGSFNVGGAGGIDSQVVAFRASPNENVSITKPGQERGGGTYAPVYNIDARGADQAAIARLERGLAERDRNFNRMVDSRVDTRQTRKTRG